MNDAVLRLPMPAGTNAVGFADDDAVVVVLNLVKWPTSGRPQNRDCLGDRQEIERKHHLRGKMHHTLAIFSVILGYPNRL